MGKNAGSVKWGIALILLAALLTLTKPLVGAAQSQPLTLTIEWPNEGEVFYAGPSSLIYTLPIKGWVESAVFEADQIQVRLRVFQNGAVVGEQSVSISLDNRFVFYATVNPQGSEGFFPAEHHACGLECHYASGFNLLSGPITLEITAMAPQGGEQVTAYRHVMVDLSHYVDVPVEVYLAEDPSQKVSGVTVSGSTWLYMWRARNFSAFSDEEGVAQLQVEALSASPTYYEFSVEPTVVEGVLYEGVDIATLTLPPDAQTAQLLRLAVRSFKGEISGRLIGAEALMQKPPSVLAIHLPEGTTQRIATKSDGSFQLSDMPIDKYLLATDSLALVEEGFFSQNKKVDLTIAYQSEVTLPMTRFNGEVVRGRVTDQDGNPLPFAWPLGEGGGKTFGALLDSGEYVLYDLPEKANTIVFSAPGYYAQRVSVDPSEGLPSSLDVRLVPQPETRRLTWGSGEVVVPAETRGEVEGLKINLERGWVWGKGGGTEPFVVQTAQATIAIPNGQFALEYIPGYAAWFYLFEGEAELVGTEGGSVQMAAGEMVNLLNDEGPVPVLYDPAVKIALNPADMPLTSAVWEPTQKEIAESQIKEIGVGVAQILTMAIYLGTIGGLIAIPTFLFYSRWKQREK